ncbi:hypothetical protein [Rhodoferax antarcticus]|uniref:hypothetical protein n=1 Tax=Rhodoferax antarcticus TaxID=81479 RepID=UPI0022253CAD|nr:hypothetical protein [Rhodoferax antarcticus]MCW2314322.1 hypothetical protein [Rhodoferax antarcticus]
MKAAKDFNTAFDTFQYVQDELQHGHSAALLTVQALYQTQDPQIRVTLLADAIGDLIDLDLGWDRMAPTLARLHGFAAGLLPLLGVSLGAPSQPQEESPATHGTPLQAEGGQL